MSFIQISRKKSASSVYPLKIRKLFILCNIDFRRTVFGASACLLHNYLV